MTWLRYLVDLGDGRPPGVLMPAKYAALLERHLGLDDLRRDVLGRNRDFDEFLLAWHTSAMQSAGSAGGIFVDGSAEPGSASPLGTNDVADRVDVTPRAVRRAAEQGRLHGRRIDGRWMFAAADVEAWRRTRRRSS